MWKSKHRQQVEQILDSSDDDRILKRDSAADKRKKGDSDVGEIEESDEEMKTHTPEEKKVPQVPKPIVKDDMINSFYAK